MPDPEDVPAEFYPRLPLATAERAIRSGGLTIEQLPTQSQRTNDGDNDSIPLAAELSAPGYRSSTRVEDRSSVASSTASIASRPWQAAAVAVAVPDDPSVEADRPEETFFIDQATGRPMVTRLIQHNGRPASVTVELNNDGHVKAIVGGTARLPNESSRHYFRQMSSFALWQLKDTPGHKGITWGGDQKYAFWCYAIILVDLILLLVEIGKNGWALQPFSENPMLGPKVQVLIDMGAKRTDLILAGEFHRLIAPWWLHGGIIHYLINMLALWGIGFSLEKEFGTPKIALIFVTCGFMGNLVSAVFLPNVVGVGASGAIFGLFGAAWSDLIQNWGLYKSRGNAKTVCCQLTFGTILNVLLGLAPILDQFAHMGGMLCGISMGFFLFLQKRFTRFGEEKPFKKRHRFLQLWGLITVPASLITFLVILYQGVDPNGWCTWCKYINCVPIQGLWNCDDSGCSTDPSVSYSVFPNSTMFVTCPVSVNNRVISVTVTSTPSTDDVIAVCQANCFT